MGRAKSALGLLAATGRCIPAGLLEIRLVGRDGPGAPCGVGSAIVFSMIQLSRFALCGLLDPAARGLVPGLVALPSGPDYLGGGAPTT